MKVNLLRTYKGNSSELSAQGAPAAQELSEQVHYGHWIWPKTEADAAVAHMELKAPEGPRDRGKSRGSKQIISNVARG